MYFPVGTPFTAKTPPPTKPSPLFVQWCKITTLSTHDNDIRGRRFNILGARAGKGGRRILKNFNLALITTKINIYVLGNLKINSLTYNVNNKSISLKMGFILSERYIVSETRTSLLLQGRTVFE